jgi:hypothetical protein
MGKITIFTVITAFMTLLFMGILPGEVLADGDETLGPPIGISIESGTSILAAGTGMLTTAGTIDITIPLGVTIKQVLLYWQGVENPDDNIIVDGNGTEITGSLIGTAGPDDNRFCFRADITARGFVSPGPNSLSVSGLEFDVNNGAGVLVIIDDGFNAAEIDLLDGDDFAFANLDPPYDTTVPQTFYFTPENVDRTASLSMFFSSVSGTASGGGFRPTAIEVTVGGATTVYNDLLDSFDGDEWDTLSLDVDIPAYAKSLTVQALSVDNLGGETGDPASFDWLTAALSVPIVEGCTPGYWKQPHHFDSWVGFEPDDFFSKVFGHTITIEGKKNIEVKKNKGKKKGKGKKKIKGKKGRKVTIEDPTLLQALEARGGGINALARHSVAALLNAASPAVSYGLSVDDVIDEFDDVYPGTKQEYNSLKDYFEGLNEQGCPLN